MLASTLHCVTNQHSPTKDDTLAAMEAEVLVIELDHLALWLVGGQTPWMAVPGILKPFQRQSSFIWFIFTHGLLCSGSGYSQKVSASDSVTVTPSR